jgi:hypothetical protein
MLPPLELNMQGPALLGELDCFAHLLSGKGLA